MLPDGRDYAARRFRTVRFRATPSSERFATVRAGTPNADLTKRLAALGSE
jgi:hypothetical protein